MAARAAISRGWHPLAPEVGLWAIDTVLKNGLPCRTIALRLSSKGLVVVGPSPTMDARSIAEVKKVGKIEYILVPNKECHHGVKRFASKHPEALLLAARAARGPLQRKTGHDYMGTEALQRALPDHAGVMVPQGLFTGEAWLWVRTRQGLAWIVADAFHFHPMVPAGIGGLGLRLVGAAPGLRISRWFSSFSVQNRGQYMSWVATRLKEENPTMMIPRCGTMIHKTDLSRQLRSLMSDRFER
jgi:hypothetical protein